MPSFRFTVYDPDVCEILQKLKQKRGVFLEVAIREFLKTDKGKEFLKMLLGGDLKESENNRQNRQKKISIDEFL